jgi:ZIP family zinc transporter
MAGVANLALVFVAGVVLVIVGHEILVDAEFDAREYEAADFRKLVLILGILTVHSFPEDIAVGVSFAELDIDDPALATMSVDGFIWSCITNFQGVIEQFAR